MIRSDVLVDADWVQAHLGDQECLDVELVHDLRRDHVDLEPGGLGRRHLVSGDVGHVDLA
jgi:hypothetical protein